MNCLPASTIFVVDDAPGIRIYLEYILRRAGYRVEVFVNAQTFLDRPRFDGVGCLVLAIHMPGITGLELQKKLGREGNHIPIIFITQSRDVDEAVESMKQGAFDFFTKPFNVKKLLAAICKALKAHRMLRQELAVTTDAHNLIATLTPREREVLALVITGKLNKQMASELDISEIMVKVHRRRVMTKMKVTSVAELVRLTERGHLGPQIGAETQKR